MTGTKLCIRCQSKNTDTCVNCSKSYPDRFTPIPLEEFLTTPEGKKYFEGVIKSMTNPLWLYRGIL